MSARATISALCLFLAVYFVSSYRLSAAGENDHEKWVATSLREMQSARIGMKRSDLEKVFETEGGLATPSHRTYAYKHCQYFKVDVDFSHDPSAGGAIENDKIERISAPYLAWPTGD